MIVSGSIGDHGTTILIARGELELEACVIGEVLAEPQGIVSMVTGFGGTRIVDMLAGEQLPRIC